VVAIARSPAMLLVFATADGKPIGSRETCGDAADVFVDSPRRRVYVICGEGAIDVFDRTGDGYAHSARIRTGAGEPLALWVFRPGP
jgi:hypothetical protein